MSQLCVICVVDKQLDTQNGSMRSPEREAPNGSVTSSLRRAFVESIHSLPLHADKKGTDSQNGSTRTPDRQNEATKSGSNPSSARGSRTKFLRSLFKRKRSTTQEKECTRVLTPRAARSQPDIRVCSPTYSLARAPTYTLLPDPESGPACMEQSYEPCESISGATFCGETTCHGSVHSLDVGMDFNGDTRLINLTVSVSLSVIDAFVWSTVHDYSEQ